MRGLPHGLPDRDVRGRRAGLSASACIPAFVDGLPRPARGQCGTGKCVAAGVPAAALCITAVFRSGSAALRCDAMRVPERCSSRCVVFTAAAPGKGEDMRAGGGRPQRLGGVRLGQQRQGPGGGASMDAESRVAVALEASTARGSRDQDCRGPLAPEGLPKARTRTANYGSRFERQSRHCSAAAQRQRPGWRAAGSCGRRAVSMPCENAPPCRALSRCG